jgi:ribosomal protein S18 acetylase RimI-like enzyme
MATIILARSEQDLSAAKQLFIEYADSLDFDLRFQDFASEIDELHSIYGPPGGRLRLAVQDGEAVGCVAVRDLGARICEIKRLYVRPAQRGRGIGRMLAEAGLNDARELGYRRIRLDTVPAMAVATALYRSMGFVDIEPYRYNPIPGAIYMELVLDRP